MKRKSRSVFDHTNVRIGERQVVRIQSNRKSCGPCGVGYRSGWLNVVVTRTGQDTFSSVNYCDRHLPANLENMRDEAMQHQAQTKNLR